MIKLVLDSFQNDKKKKSFFQRHLTGSSSNEGDSSSSPLASPQVNIISISKYFLKFHFVFYLFIFIF